MRIIHAKVELDVVLKLEDNVHWNEFLDECDFIIKPYDEDQQEGEVASVDIIDYELTDSK